MNLNDVFDRAYENALRQGYAIDQDVLRLCIETMAAATAAFDSEQIAEILAYVKENPELLPSEPAEVSRWCGRWWDYFAELRCWHETPATDGEEKSPPPLLFQFGL